MIKKKFFCINILFYNGIYIFIYIISPKSNGTEKIISEIVSDENI